MQIKRKKIWPNMPAVILIMLALCFKTVVAMAEPKNCADHSTHDPGETAKILLSDLPGKYRLQDIERSFAAFDSHTESFEGGGSITHYQYVSNGHPGLNPWLGAPEPDSSLVPAPKQLLAASPFPMLPESGLNNDTPSAVKEKFPRPTGAVNDFAGVISTEYRERMNRISREIIEKTGTAIVVATVATIGDNEFKSYVNRLYTAWGIGRKGEDKGVLIVLAIKERKIRIETGYGMEGILPESLLREIRDRSVLPWLKAGHYGKGLYEGVAAIAGTLAKTPMSGMPGIRRKD